MNTLQLLGRTEQLFTDDFNSNQIKLSEVVSASTFLVIGGAGSIGQAVTKEFFNRNPLKVNVLDISENNMVNWSKILIVYFNEI